MNEAMTNERLAEIKAGLQALKPGPWLEAKASEIIVHDWEFHCHAAECMAELVAEVERLRACLGYFAERQNWRLILMTSGPDWLALNEGPALAARGLRGEWDGR